MVWAKTAHLGCGQVTHVPERGLLRKLLVCNYGPSGNGRSTSELRLVRPAHLLQSVLMDSAVSMFSYSEDAFVVAFKFLDTTVSGKATTELPFTTAPTTMPTTTTSSTTSAPTSFVTPLRVITLPLTTVTMTTTSTTMSTTTSTTTPPLSTVQSSTVFSHSQLSSIVRLLLTPTTSASTNTATMSSSMMRAVTLSSTFSSTPSPMLPVEAATCMSEEQLEMAESVEDMEETEWGADQAMLQNHSKRKKKRPRSKFSLLLSKLKKLPFLGK